MISTQKSQQFKGALAKETGIIQMMIQQRLSRFSTVPLAVVPETDYDTQSGENPRSIRYRPARTRHEDYREFLPQGSEQRTFASVDAAGRPVELTGTAEVNAHSGDVVGTKVHMGYDEKTRCVKRTAIETEIINCLSIVEKEDPRGYIMALRENLVDSAIERYSRSVERDIISLSYWKAGVAEAFSVSTDKEYFTRRPTGGLSIGFLKRLRDRLRAHKYEEGAGTPMIGGRPAIRVYAGTNAIEQAIESYKRTKGHNIHTAPRETDTEFGETVVYDGIQFIENDMPMRAWLRQTGTGKYELVEVLPTVNVVASGGGIYEEVNEPYYDGHITVDGRREPLYEVGYVTHPEAMERQRFQKPMLHEMFNKAGAKYAAFDVRYLNDSTLFDGWDLAGDRIIVPNEDLNLAKMKVEHAYAPFSLRPEKMASFIYRVSPDVVDFVSPVDDDNVVGGDEVTIGRAADMQQNPVQTAAYTEEVKDYTLPTCEVPFPADEGGEERMASCAISIATDITAGTTQICVERLGGSAGIAAVRLDSADGTATAGTHYTAIVDGKIQWADGEAGIKCIDLVTADNGDNAGLDFTVVVTVDGSVGSNVAVLAAEPDNCQTTTVTFEDPAAVAADCPSC